MSSKKRRAVFGSTVAAVAAVPFVGAGEAHAATFEVTNLDDTGPGSLRDAILAANANAGADVITFQSGLTGTITVGSALGVTGPTTIVGPGADVITVAGATSGVFYLYGTGGMEVTISDLTITGGYAEIGANIFAIDTDLTLDSVVVTDGYAALGGGLAIVGSGSTLTIIDSEFSENNGVYAGGGVFIAGISEAESTIDGSLIDDNGAGDGGGLAVGEFVPKGRLAPIQEGAFAGSARLESVRSRVESMEPAVTSLVITDTTISDNDAIEADEGGGDGGGVFAFGSSVVTFERSTISGNTADDDGGGIHGNAYYAGGVNLVDTTVSGNTAESDGGGIYFYDGALNITSSTVSGNLAESDGGGIYFYDGELVMTNSTVSGNTADSDGGGIYIYDGEVDLVHSTITGNSALYGGNIYFYDGDLTLDHTAVANGVAPEGPDIYFGESEPTFEANWSLIEDPSVVPDSGANNISGDPLLGALADNGGLTQTHLPAAGSTMIEGGDPAVLMPPTADQRGLARIAGDVIDIGAVEVEVVNNPPVGVPDAVTVGAGGAVTINVLGNDSDPDADVLSLVSVTQGTKGSVTISGGQVLYLAAAGASGQDTFTYTLSDGENSVTVTVTVTIRAAGILPATGAETDLPLAAGVALTLLGGAMVAGTRRRRPAR